MKAVLIFALAFVVLQIDAKPLLRFKRGSVEEDSLRCVNDLNLDKDEILEINNRKYAPEDNQGYIKFMECYWTKKGYLREDESINYDALDQMLSDSFGETFNVQNITNNPVSSCRRIQADSAGLKAIKVENCILRNLRERKNSH